VPHRRLGGAPPGRSPREAGPVAFPAVPPVGIVGPGRAGLALAVALRRARVTVVGVHGRSVRPVSAGIKLTVGGLPPWLGRARVVVCAVGDDALPACAVALAAAGGDGGMGSGQVVLHLSGALTSEVLAPLAALGAATGSMHPLMSLGRDPVVAARRLRGATCTVEGDIAAVGAADAIVRRIGAVPVPIPPELKALYHAGAVFASNYVVTMVAVAVRLLERAGIATDDAIAALLPLAHGSLDDVAAAGPAAALTGPVARGDLATIRRHLAGLGHADAVTYRAVAREAAKLAREAGLDPERAAKVDELLR
jgi:predicted short-subunit dehydrogenase-like oxidoreductase (DUF2520 family)